MKDGLVKRGRTWTYVISQGYDESGKKRQTWKGGFRTRDEAKTARAQAMTRMAEGTYVPPVKMTVAAFLREWLAGAKTTGIRPSTLASYRLNVERHIIPRLGGWRLQELTPGAIEAVYSELLASGRADGQGLSPQTVKYVAMILKHALSIAVRKRYLVRNPAADATAPRPVRGREMKTWTADEVGRFLGHVRGDDLFAAYLIAVTCGTRRGETLGLRWGDVDFERGRVSIQQTVLAVGYALTFSTPKTAKGRRTVALEAAALEALREHRRRQIETRLAFGPDYRTDLDLVFARADGSPVHPERLTRSFDAHVRAAGLPRIRLHDLRHTNASIMLAAGVPAKVASERLGHSSIAITLDTYSHVLPGLQEDAAAKIGAAIFGT